MNYCLPKNFAKKLLDALQSDELDVDVLAAMETSAERRAAFEPYVGKENAAEVNALFESKMLLKDQQRGLESWVNSLLGIKKAVRRDMLAKIAKMDKVLSPSDEHGFLADLAEQKLGTAVTQDEAQKITDLAKTAQEARDNPGKNLSGVSDEYLKASQGLRHYVLSLKPTTALASIGRNALVIGRNHLLMNPSTPIKTTENQILNSAMEAVGRRIGARAVSGASGDVIAQANKEAWATFRKTGMNTAAMETIDDAGMLGEKANFDLPGGMVETHSALHAVESGVRWYAGMTNKVAIDWEHNIAYTKFYQKAFFDMLNIGASNIAKGEGLKGDALKARADEIAKDAARVQPETDAGTLLRSEGQKQAARVTSTNETWLSNLAMGMKAVLNGEGRIAGQKIPGIKGMGDLLMPIAKIPANVIWNGIENAGVGLPLGTKDIVQSAAKMRSEDPGTQREGAAQFANGIQRLARTFGTLAVAAFLSNQLKQTDFRTDNYGHHFVKIFGLWVNMEYISAASPALGGMMYAKKYGRAREGMAATAGHYVSGALQGLKSAPGIDELESLVTSVTKSNAVQGFEQYVKGSFATRLAPAFVPNLFLDRPANRLAFGAHGVETPQEVAKDNATAAAHRRANRIENQR